MKHKTLVVTIDRKLFDRLKKLAAVPIDLRRAHYAALHVGIGALERADPVARTKILTQRAAAAPPQFGENPFAAIAQQEKVVNEAVKRAEAARIEAARAAHEQDEADAHLTEAKAMLDRLRTANPVGAPARSLLEQPQPRAAETPPSHVRDGTWSDKISWVLGDEVMSAAEIDVALKRAGLIPRTSQTLAVIIDQLQTRRTVTDSVGEPVTHIDGEPVQVRVFEQVTRGRYRVAPTPVLQGLTLTLHSGSIS